MNPASDVEQETSASPPVEKGNTMTIRSDQSARTRDCSRRDLNAFGGQRTVTLDPMADAGPHPDSSHGTLVRLERAEGPIDPLTLNYEAAGASTSHVA